MSDIGKDQPICFQDNIEGYNFRAYRHAYRPDGYVIVTEAGSTKIVDRYEVDDPFEASKSWRIPAPDLPSDRG